MKTRHIVPLRRQKLICNEVSLVRSFHFNAVFFTSNAALCRRRICRRRRNRHSRRLAALSYDQRTSVHPKRRQVCLVAERSFTENSRRNFGTAVWAVGGNVAVLRGDSTEKRKIQFRRIQRKFSLNEQEKGDFNPILHTWIRERCFTCDGSSTIQVFLLIFA